MARKLPVVLATLALLLSTAAFVVALHNSAQRGARGLQGPRGGNGVTGARGPQGLPGIRGPIGPPGDAASAINVTCQVSDSDWNTIVNEIEADLMHQLRGDLIGYAPLISAPRVDCSP